MATVVDGGTVAQWQAAEDRPLLNLGTEGGVG